METPTTDHLILWLGDGAPSKTPSGARIVARAWSQADGLPSADLIVLAGEGRKIPARQPAPLLSSATPMVLLGDLEPKELRRALNHYPVFRILHSANEIPEALAEALTRTHLRGAREQVLADFSRRNRELEEQTEQLEAAVKERTGFLESSAKEEKDKLARERQMIRFLTELSTMTATEDILRALRRELRRYHRIQSLIVAVGEGGRARFYSSQGDRVLQAEGADDLASLAGDGLRLRQTLANRFGRPFNKLLIRPLELRQPAHGVFGAEYSLLSDSEVQEVDEILQERGRATGMAIERLNLEDRLRRFAIRWERTFDGFRDPIAVIDTDLQVLRGNRSFSAGAQRRKCHEVFAGRPIPCEGCPVGAGPGSVETVVGTVRVGRRAYRLRSWPVMEGDRISGRVNHYNDITEARELSLRMLQNEKMSAIGELAGHIAHELNNPLTGIRSLAQVLKAESTEVQLTDDLAHIENAARRCQTIIHHLLEFTRGGDGEVTGVRIDEIVGMTLPLLKTALRPHRQEIFLEAGAACFPADAHLIQQVVFNLINNACQALTRPGRITVATRAVHENGAREVELRVADDGPGIPLEIKTRLFEPFVTSKKEGEGTGLGLSTSKAIVERFGGRIRCVSEEGRGAEFILRFPSKEAP